MKKIGLISSLVLSLASFGPAFTGNHDLHFPALATTWDEGIPLGNGMLGALVWQKGDHLRFSLDRADLWDLRPMENLNTPEFSFKWVQEQVRKKEYKPVQDKFDKPYDMSPAPTKIPGAALEFNTAGFGEVKSVSLLTQNALCTVDWNSGARLETFVDASDSAGWFRFRNLKEPVTPVLVPPAYNLEGTAGDGNPVTGLDLRRLGYKKGNLAATDHIVVYRQAGWNGFQYEVAVTWNQVGDKLTGCWTITAGKNNHAGDQLPVRPGDAGYGEALKKHTDWWQTFWSRSSISVPDPVLEKQWYLEQYKFGSTARPTGPPISLQAVWTADNGKLPPWKGDFHHDLNTQLSYWPSYSGNHLDLEEGFLNWLWSCRETFRKYTRTYFGTGGMNVPGVTTLTGEPMGGWIQYSFGPTVGCWLAQHFYLHWQYSQDKNFLAERAYPWISDVAQYLREVSVDDGSGGKKLPISSSPEINNNSIDAWFPKTTNFDLAFIRWTFEKASELATVLGKREDAAHWKAELKKWPAFALDSLGGLAFAPGYPYKESHRHFSHLVGWHPLGVIDWQNGPAEKSMIRETLKNLEKTGPDWWCGYSYSWLGNLYARAEMGDKAAEALRIFSENFCLPNTFHVNGEQHNKGYSKMKYRPFTLEGNFAFASALQEMMVQSHTGTLRIFPALPTGWSEASFTSLRCEGAFLVSATKAGGKIARVEILSEKGGQCRLKNPFAPGTCREEYSWKGAKATGGELLSIRFPAGGKLVLTAL